MNLIVKKLWDNRYRVNYYIEKDGRKHMPESYFIKTRDGKVVESNPELPANRKLQIEGRIATMSQPKSAVNEKVPKTQGSIPKKPGEYTIEEED